MAWLRKPAPARHLFFDCSPEPPSRDPSGDDAHSLQGRRAKRPLQASTAVPGSERDEASG